MRLALTTSQGLQSLLGCMEVSWMSQRRVVWFTVPNLKAFEKSTAIAAVRSGGQCLLNPEAI